MLGRGGQMVCRTCHIPHGSEEKESLLAVKNHKDSLCVHCHREQSEIVDTVHYKIVVTKGEKDREVPGMLPWVPALPAIWPMTDWGN